MLVTHSATAMALTNALLGIPQAVHPLGPLANCHWSELYAEPTPRRRAACGGCAGTTSARPAPVVPLPVRPELGAEDATDADA